MVRKGSGAGAGAGSPKNMWIRWIHFAPFVTHMEESGEKCSVVFVLIVTEPASERVFVSWFRNNLCKDDSAFVLQIPPWPHSNISFRCRRGLTVLVEPSPAGTGTFELLQNRSNLLGSGSDLFHMKKLPILVSFLLKRIFLNLLKIPCFLHPEIFFFSSSFCWLSQVWRIGSGESRIRTKTFQIHTLLIKSSVKSLLPTKQIIWLVLFLIYLLCL